MTARKQRVSAQSMHRLGFHSVCGTWYHSISGHLNFKTRPTWEAMTNGLIQFGFKQGKVSAFRNVRELIGAK